jgi:hypothetical protein
VPDTRVVRRGLAGEETVEGRDFKSAREMKDEKKRNRTLGGRGDYSLPSGFKGMVNNPTLQVLSCNPLLPPLWSIPNPFIVRSNNGLSRFRKRTPSIGLRNTFPSAKMPASRPKKNVFRAALALEHVALTRRRIRRTRRLILGKWHHESLRFLPFGGNRTRRLPTEP